MLQLFSSMVPPWDRMPLAGWVSSQDFRQALALFWCYISTASPPVGAKTKGDIPASHSVSRDSNAVVQCEGFSCCFHAFPDTLGGRCRGAPPSGSSQTRGPQRGKKSTVFIDIASSSPRTRERGKGKEKNIINKETHEKTS